jgi:hypothetical protein
VAWIKWHPGLGFIGALVGRATLALSFLAMHAQAETANQTNACENIEHADHPKTTLSNGKLTVVIFLPDAQKGYYRSTRFDWAGIIPCVSLNGHRFFGEWFIGAYDPMRNDAVVGPVEEFRIDDGVLGHYPANSPLLTINSQAIGYDEAKPGEAFLKPGVGILKKIDDQPYSYHTIYPVLDGGTWTTPKMSRTSITFRQVLNGRDGWAYVYEKTLTLDANGTGMTLEHSLRNTGQKPIDTKVYDHDFITFDMQPAGPDVVVRFPFVPKPANPLDSALEIKGKELHFAKVLDTGQIASMYFTGYSDKVSDYDITVENVRTGVGVEQTSDTPISRANFWTNGRATCPEIYIHVPVEPGKTTHWKLHYRFFAPAA